MVGSMQFSICTTNYQCAYVLDRHLASVYEHLKDYDFEYIVVDNKSKDGSLDILKKWEGQHPNMKVLSKKCTMGEGRQISFGHSRGDFILVPDTDVIYYPKTRRFLELYLERDSELAVQAAEEGVSTPSRTWTCG
jgi:glycosyltransferase involved in cell wall biosynthesis